MTPERAHKNKVQRAAGVASVLWGGFGWGELTAHSGRAEMQFACAGHKEEESYFVMFMKLRKKIAIEARRQECVFRKSPALAWP